jgi:hypothetical protein
MSASRPARSGGRLAELVAALSFATDLAMRQPTELGLRTCLLAARLGEALGMDERELTTVVSGGTSPYATPLWPAIGHPPAW